jgi:hypothetical protein
MIIPVCADRQTVDYRIFSYRLFSNQLLAFGFPSFMVFG